MVNAHVAYTVEQYSPPARQTVSGSLTTQFLYDGDALVAEYNGSGTLLRRYVHGPNVDEPLVWYEGAGIGDRRWLHPDASGSIMARTDATGHSPERYAYGPYGEPQTVAGARFRYTGQIMIPEGSVADAALYYYKSRFYDTKNGRFLQTDSIGYQSDINLYTYAGNDPVNATDPTGDFINFIINPGATQAQADAAMAYLREQSSLANERLADVDNSATQVDVIVDPTVWNHEGTRGGRLTVWWNPTRQLETKNGQRESPALNLCHELCDHTWRHLQDPAQYKIDQTASSDQYDMRGKPFSINETKAVNFTNEVARQAHEPTQTNYGDVKMRNGMPSEPRTNDVTAHTPVQYPHGVDDIDSNSPHRF